MIRFIIFVAALFGLAGAFAWLADRPGELVLTWQDYRITTSMMAAAIAIAALVATLTVVGALLRAVVRAPRTVSGALGARRRDRGYRALSRGMVAVGAGDSRAARRAAQEARSLLGGDPLVLLLSAQTAQIAGDRDAARTAFEQLSDGSDTRVLGLHGLFVEAQRQGEDAAAVHFAEEAHRLSSHIPWAGRALFDYRSRAGDWDGALEALAANLAANLVDKNRARRLRAVLLTSRAIELEAGSPDEAHTAALEAAKLAPDLTPAAVVAARLSTRAGDTRRATRLLEAAWKNAPHPEVAAAYAEVRTGEPVRDRLKRVQKLAGLVPDNPEGPMAIAHAAITAHEWSTARQALEGLVQAGPSERVCLLMADIEEGESGDLGRVRTWLARALGAPRDPVWTADGRVFEAWAPVSPVSGQVDTFAWRVIAQPPSLARAIDLDVDKLGPAVADAGQTASLESTKVTPDMAAEAVVPPANEKALQAKVADALGEEAGPPSPDDPGPAAGAAERGGVGIRRG